jgi:hypothetical protein
MATFDFASDGPEKSSIASKLHSLSRYVKTIEVDVNGSCRMPSKTSMMTFAGNWNSFEKKAGNKLSQLDCSKLLNRSNCCIEITSGFIIMSDRSKSKGAS